MSDTLVSVFTPSHNYKWISDSYKTLKAQTYSNWEWIVLPNGEHANTIISLLTNLNDTRIKILAPPTWAAGIGALKNIACNACTGDIFVELDHDDLLTPDCLETIVNISKQCPEEAFIFSDSVSCDFEGKSNVFSPDFGWRTYNWEYEGNKYKINKCFPVTARSLCEVLYSPDHVRAWTRKAYHLAGGHNTTLRVGDDHELMIRTYLKGIHFEYIARPLYFHRQDGHTTSQVLTQDIQALSYLHRNIYIRTIIEEWCRRKALDMYSISPPGNTPKGYKSIWPDEEADVNWDFRRDSSIDYYIPRNPGVIRCDDFLNTLTPEESISFMNNIYKLLPHGSWLTTNTPSIVDDTGKIGLGAFQDPRFKSHWSINNFAYFTEKLIARQIPEIKCRFQAVRGFHYYQSAYHKNRQMPNVLFDLVCIKDDKDHYPGPVMI